MHEEQLDDIAEQPTFIPDIYNYCDRWCDRCPFTSRCMTFALSRDQFGSPEAVDTRNQYFWQKLSEAFHVTRELLEQTLKLYGLQLTEDDLNAAKQQELEKQARLESHPCAQTAKQYIAFAERWFERMISEENVEIKEIFDILHWYKGQIYVKIMRALSGQYDENLLCIADDERPRDFDGSAKVALIGIDRSIVAWIKLRDVFPEQKDDMIDILIHLDRLRKAIEQTFPNARAFIRPGFDEISEA